MEKMREEFETWWMENMNAMEMDLHRFADGYSCHDTNRGWMAWQASRAALCVELPDSERSVDCGDVLYRSDVEDALDAAGIRYT